MKTYALDFETTYTKEMSVAVQGPRAYFLHPQFDAYLVTVVGDDGYEFAGNPRDFDWGLLEGQTVICHNAQFDHALYLVGIEQKWWPKVNFTCHCSADMCAYLGLPRSLKGASAKVLGVEVDKQTRANMINKRWETMSTEFREEVLKYAIEDSRLTLKLWQKLSNQWPEHERNISLLNREISAQGIPIDSDALAKSLNTIRQAMFDTENAIPWTKEATPLSRKAFNKQCREQGITPPKSLAQDNPDADKWFREHIENCPWAKAVSDWRRINTFLKKLVKFDLGTLSDSRYYGGFLYCGANPTARFSGGGASLNLQNLPRDEMFGINFRHLIHAPKGKKLIMADLGQIEVRTLAYLSEDKETLDLIRESDDIYHAFGILLGMHDPANGELKEYDKKIGGGLRHRIKATALGCGYMMSAARFSVENNMSLAEAEEAVNTYRTRMKKVVGLWSQVGKDMNTAHAVGMPYEWTLPSGRTLRYGMLRRMRDTKSGRYNLISKLVRMGGYRDTKVYSGHVVENASQALARDIFCDIMLRLKDAGLKIIMHVHDEVMIEVDDVDVDDALKAVNQIMTTPPDWIPDISLQAEAIVSDHYIK